MINTKYRAGGGKLNYPATSPGSHLTASTQVKVPSIAVDPSRESAARCVAIVKKANQVRGCVRNGLVNNLENIVFYRL